MLASVEASFLAAAFEVIRADYGDLEGYFRDGLGLGPRERAALEARYLEVLISPHGCEAARSHQAAASISASRSAMTSSKAEIAC